MRQSGAEALVTEEPYALIAHVRVCGGAGWVTTGSTRKPTRNSLRSYVALALARGSPPALGRQRSEVASTMDKSRLYPWNRRLLSIALFCHLCLAAVPVYAQPRFEGEGRVVAVDETQGTVTLDHGPILGLMPAMRMAFPVQQVERLQGLQVGAVVRFSLQARGPEWVIATIEPVGEAPSPRAASFPAPDFTLPTLSGTSIRLSALQGKVVL